MGKDTKHKVKLTELEMALILQSINKTAYLGANAELVAKVKKKMTVKILDPDDGAPVTD